jgi:hypothetical protein
LYAEFIPEHPAAPRHNYDFVVGHGVKTVAAAATTNTDDDDDDDGGANNDDNGGDNVSAISLEYTTD